MWAGCEWIPRLFKRLVSLGKAGSLQREMSTEEIELAARSQDGGPSVSAPAHMTLQKVSGSSGAVAVVFQGKGDLERGWCQAQLRVCLGQ